MNIYDGTVTDKLWVGHSKFWIIPGLEDNQFGKLDKPFIPVCTIE